MSSGWSSEGEEEIESSSSKSSLESEPSKIEKITPKSIREMAEKIKQSSEAKSKDSWREEFDRFLESSNDLNGDFTRDAEVTREALPIIDDIADLEKLSPKVQDFRVPDSPKEQANVEYVETAGTRDPNTDSRVEVPIIREIRFDDESIDRSDDENDELHVCRDNLKTYPPRWVDVIYVGTRVPRIVKRPDDFFGMFETSLVVPPPRQKQSPTKIKFHPSVNYRANQLWDEFVSNNPDIFAKNTSSNSAGTDEGQNIRKRKFFKTDRNTRSGLDMSETRKVPAPEKKQRKSETKPAWKVESVSCAPEIITIDDSCSRINNRNVYEISSDSDEEPRVYPQKSASQTRRPRNARDQYARLMETKERSVEAPIQDFPSLSRSSSRRSKQEQTKQATDKRSMKPIHKDEYRSKSPNRKSSATQSRFKDRVENLRSNVMEQSATALDQYSQRKIDEASASRLVAAKNRRLKRLKIGGRLKNRNESEITLSLGIREEAAITKNWRSEKKIDKPSRSRSVFENDRQSKKLGFAERMRRRKSTAAPISASISSPAFSDNSFCDLAAQEDCEMAESECGKNPNFTKGARVRNRVINFVNRKIRSRKIAVDESAGSQIRIGEASGSRPVLVNDRDRQIFPFDEKTRKLESTTSPSSAIISSPAFCDLGAPKDREIARSTIDKSPDFMENTRTRGKVVNCPAERIQSWKTTAQVCAVSKSRGESNQEIGSLYDERSLIADLKSTKPKRISKTVEGTDVMMGDTKTRDFPDNPRKCGDSKTNHTISALTRSRPVIRTNVALTAERVHRISNDRWEIVQRSTATQISR